MKYRWVHLSDIHFAYKDYFSNRIRDQLFKKLQQISRQDKVNFLFITGDLTDKNADYTEELYKFGSIINVGVCLSFNIYFYQKNNALICTSL